MRNTWALLTVVISAVLCGCAATSLKQTWKSPDYQGGPVQKIAVLVMAEQELQRSALENSYVNGLQGHGQAAMITHNLLKLEDIKADKQAAARQLREAGADTILIVRVADRVTHDQQIRVAPDRFSSGGDSFGTADWHDYYMTGATSMDTAWGELRQDIYLDNSMHDLNSGKRLWFGVTQTVMKQGTDWLAEIKPLTTKVLAALRKDGMIR